MSSINRVESQGREEKVIVEAPQPFIAPQPVTNEERSFAGSSLPSTSSSSRALQHISKVTVEPQATQSPSSAVTFFSACLTTCGSPPGRRLDGAKIHCLCHKSVLNLVAAQPTEQLLPMDRFLSGGPGEQPALFVVGDCGHVSTNKGCTCDNVGPKLEISDKEEQLENNGTEKDEEAAAQDI